MLSIYALYYCTYIYILTYILFSQDVCLTLLKRKSPHNPCTKFALAHRVTIGGGGGGFSKLIQKNIVQYARCTCHAASFVYIYMCSLSLLTCSLIHSLTCTVPNSGLTPYVGTFLPTLGHQKLGTRTISNYSMKTLLFFHFAHV